MIGAFTIGKKAVTFGYKRYGIPGAIASGGAALAGYVAVRRALRSLSESGDDSIESAIDAASIKNAIDADGLQAVTDPQLLDEAIDQDELLSNVEMDDLTSSIGQETEEFTAAPDDVTPVDDQVTDAADEATDIGDEFTAGEGPEDADTEG